MFDKTRLYATTVIWGAFAVIIGMIITALVVTNAEITEWGAVFLLILIGILTTAVVHGTNAVWNVQDAETEEERRAKAKRRSPVERRRVARLIESLDDDEIYDLEALLLDRDDSLARDNRT